MSLIKMSRMCEALESVTPTRKIEILNSSLSHFTDKPRVIRILSREYEMNNIAEKKAVKWLADIFGVFEWEIEDATHKWLDLGEGLIQEGFSLSPSDSQISTEQFHRLLELDCSSMNSNSFYTIRDAIRSMSALELKWFVRYWLRTPRNGVDCSIVTKTLSKYYTSEVDVYAKTNSLSMIVHYLENDITPPNLVHGAYVKPMLAKKYNGKNLPTNYIIDTKYDGNRYQIHRHGDSVIIFNRKGKIVTEQYSDIVEIVLMFSTQSAIFDCEIYPVDNIGQPTAHQSLATRVHSKDKAEAILKCPVKLVIFDILLSESNVLIDNTYESRLDVLKKLVPTEYQTKLYSHNNIEAAYYTAINDGFEGIMIKNLDSPYESKRSSSLLKHKPPRVELDLVITSGNYGTGRRTTVISSFGVSVRDDNSITGFTEIGQVGSGVSEKELDSLTVRLKKIVDSYKADTFYFLPRIVVEVSCDAITKNQDGSYGMRFPRILRIRDDKYPSECDTIITVSDNL